MSRVRGTSSVSNDELTEIGYSGFGDRLPRTDANDLKALKQDPSYLAVRVHSNSLANLPIALILGLTLELNGLPRSTLHKAFALFFAWRPLHAELGIFKRGHGAGRMIGFWGSYLWMFWASWATFNLTGGWKTFLG